MIDKELEKQIAHLDDLAGKMPLIKAWVAAIDTKIEELLIEGHAFENATLAPKRATRKWYLEGDALIDLLSMYAPLDKVAPRVPLSPSQMEKEIGKKLYIAEMAEQVFSESSGLGLKYIK
jgi:hypothetical protein